MPSWSAIERVPRSCAAWWDESPRKGTPRTCEPRPDGSLGKEGRLSPEGPSGTMSPAGTNGPSASPTGLFFPQRPPKGGEVHRSQERSPRRSMVGGHTDAARGTVAPGASSPTRMLPARAVSRERSQPYGAICLFCQYLSPKAMRDRQLHPRPDPGSGAGGGEGPG